MRVQRVVFPIICIAIGVACSATVFAKGSHEVAEAEARIDDVAIVVRLGYTDFGGRILIEQLGKEKKAGLPADLQSLWDRMTPIANVQVFSYSPTTVAKVLKEWDKEGPNQDNEEVTLFPDPYPMKIFLTRKDGRQISGPITILYRSSPGKAWKSLTFTKATPPEAGVQATLSYMAATTVLTITKWPAGDPMIFEGP